LVQASKSLNSSVSSVLHYLVEAKWNIKHMFHHLGFEYKKKKKNPKLSPSSSRSSEESEMVDSSSSDEVQVYTRTKRKGKQPVASHVHIPVTRYASRKGSTYK